MALTHFLCAAIFRTITKSSRRSFPACLRIDFHTNNSKGIAAGYTALLGPNLINNFR